MMTFEEALQYLEDYTTKVTIVRNGRTTRWKCIVEYVANDQVATKGHRPEDTYSTLQGAVIETQKQLQTSIN